VGWLDALERRARDAVGSVPAAPVPARQSVKPRPAPVIKTVPVQTAAPFGSSPGAITVGYYSVQDDVVMQDEDGRPRERRQHLRAGEDPKTPDFNRALDYPNVGVA
jgi:hypothetical protein